MKFLLFETKAGDWLLAWFERWTGLALVDVGEVGSIATPATHPGCGTIKQVEV